MELMGMEKVVGNQLSPYGVEVGGVFDRGFPNSLHCAQEKMLLGNACNDTILLKRGWERGMDAPPQFISAD